MLAKEMARRTLAAATHIHADTERLLSLCEKILNRTEATMALVDDVKTRVAALEDGVKGLFVHIDTLKAAFDDLKAHPVVVEDPALKDIADRIGAVTDSLSAEASKIGVSGGAA